MTHRLSLRQRSGGCQGGMEATAQAAGGCLWASPLIHREWRSGSSAWRRWCRQGCHRARPVRVVQDSPNLGWALAYNLVGIPVAAALLPEYGVSLNPAAAGAMMALSSVAVVTNSLFLKVPGGPELGCAR